jgi:hypothetical protein
LAVPSCWCHQPVQPPLLLAGSDPDALPAVPVEEPPEPGTGKSCVLNPLPAAADAREADEVSPPPLDEPLLSLPLAVGAAVVLPAEDAPGSEDPPVARAPVAEPLSDELLSDEPLADEPLADEPLADEPLSKDPLATGIAGLFALAATPSVPNRPELVEVAEGLLPAVTLKYVVPSVACSAGIPDAGVPPSRLEPRM